MSGALCESPPIREVNACVLNQFFYITINIADMGLAPTRTQGDILHV